MTFSKLFLSQMKAAEVNEHSSRPSAASKPWEVLVVTQMTLTG